MVVEAQILSREMAHDYLSGTTIPNCRDTQVMLLSFLPRISVRDKLRQESRFFGGPGFRIKCGMTAQKVTTESGAFMQNKAKVKIGKMSISIARIKDYENEQQTINNERYSKQTQFKANFETPHSGQSQVARICQNGTKN